MSYHSDRREFLRQAMLAGTTLPWVSKAWAEEKQEASKSPNEKLRVGVVGVAARGRSNLNGVAGEEVVALCDIDAQRLEQAATDFPKAKTYGDYRKLLDEQKLDCLVVSTPDHMHAFPVVAALQAGLDVYCEKPMAHSVWEVRQIREWAVKQKAVTQLGTQIHNTGDNYRRVVEIVQSGQLGEVNRVHVWLGGGMKVFDKAETLEKPPAHVDYDLWVGPSPYRPFSDAHFHFNWRFWWDFGNGALGDFGCHYMDLPFWALNLPAPATVKTQGEKGHTGVNDCPLDLQVDYHFPLRASGSAVHLTWYQGKYRPEEFKTYGGGKNSGVLFEGTKGRLLADYSSRKIFMGDGSTPLAPPQSIAPSPGHHAEFLQAVRTRNVTTCNFHYSGNLTEAVLLGNVSYRAGNQLLEWDAAELTASNCPQAAQYIRREYRKGWKLAEA